jgi:hypothetical protein
VKLQELSSVRLLMSDVCLCMKFNNFKSLLDLCSGVSYVQVWWETLRIAAWAAKLYLPVSCRAPLTFRLWSCSRSYNFVIKSGNFWTTQLVLRLITLLYDSLQLLYQSRGSQGWRRRGLNTYCSRLGRSLSAKYGMSYVSVSSSLNSSKVT